MTPRMKRIPNLSKSKGKLFVNFVSLFAVALYEQGVPIFPQVVSPRYSVGNHIPTFQNLLLFFRREFFNTFRFNFLTGSDR